MDKLVLSDFFGMKFAALNHKYQRIMFSITLNRFIVIFALIVLSRSAFSQDPNALINQMFTSVKSLKGLTFTIDSRERVNGRMRDERISFKININPFKEYIYQHSPKKGLQVLYVTGKNDGKAKVNPGAFPWVILNLHPENDLMLDNHHHSIFDAGYHYTTSILEFLLQKYSSQKTNIISMNDPVKMMDVDCYHLTFVNPNYRLTVYTPVHNETPMIIARKLHIDYFTILEYNAGLKPNSVIPDGMKLTIPNDYASRMEIYINKITMIPVYLKIYDNKGLFEEFTFFNIVLNPVFKDIDFSEKNPAYKF